MTGLLQVVLAEKVPKAHVHVLLKAAKYILTQRGKRQENLGQFILHNNYRHLMKRRFFC